MGLSPVSVNLKFLVTGNIESTMERPPTPFLQLFPILTLVELLLQGLLIPNHPVTADLPEFAPLLAFFSPQSDLVFPRAMVLSFDCTWSHQGSP